MTFRYLLSQLRLSVCLSVCRLSVLNVRTPYSVDDEAFGNVSSLLYTLAIL